MRDNVAATSRGGTAESQISADQSFPPAVQRQPSGVHRVNIADCAVCSWCAGNSGRQFSFSRRSRHQVALQSSLLLSPARHIQRWTPPGPGIGHCHNCCCQTYSLAGPRLTPARVKIQCADLAPGEHSDNKTVKPEYNR